MQYLSGAVDRTSGKRNYANAGVDMRTISTDDIQEVTIVRGIPSVQYGDLTSGLVKVKRTKGGNFLSARFKADMDSKLFYLAKAFEWQSKNYRSTSVPTILTTKQSHETCSKPTNASPFRHVLTNNGTQKQCAITPR